MVIARAADTGRRRADSARFALDLLGVALSAYCARVVDMSDGVYELPVGAAVVVVYGYDTAAVATVDQGAASRATVLAGRFVGRGVPVIQVALGVIDDLADSPADVLVACYSPHRASVAALARTLFEHGRAPGVLPVWGPRWRLVFRPSRWRITMVVKNWGRRWLLGLRLFSAAAQVLAHIDGRQGGSARTGQPIREFLGGPHLGMHKRPRPAGGREAHARSRGGRGRRPSC
ncbi:hypothetical protein [Actinophytocola sediminis]